MATAAKQDPSVLARSTIVVPSQQENKDDADMDDEPQSMNGQFFQLLKEFDNIINNYMTDERHMKPCIDRCLMLCKTVEKADLWSNNEVFDDIQTDYIKFGLLPSMLSQLYSNRNPPNRVTWLIKSTEYANLFLNRCDQWGALSKMDQNSFYQLKEQASGKGDKNGKSGTKNSSINISHKNEDDDSKSSSNPNTKQRRKSGIEIVESLSSQFAERNELILRHKMDQADKEQIDVLLNDSKLKHVKAPNSENKWKLFKDEETEREYWQIKLQIAIRHALRTIKQNMDELPMAIRMDNEARQRKLNTLSKYGKNDKHTSIDDYKQNFKEWQPRDSQLSTNINDNIDKAKPQASGNIKVTMIDKGGKMEKFDNLASMKSRIDAKIEERANARDLVFRESNPWTYTVEQAAELGLLSEIPKDYFEKQKQSKMAALDAKHRAQRYAPDWEATTNADDGSQLNVGQVEYHRVGGVTTFTENDMPKQETEKHTDDMNDAEYEQHMKETRAWEAWKDDHAKGSGNPYS